MPKIQVIALRPFLWSENGYTEIAATEKQVFDLPERLFDGLNRAGYVRRAIIGDGHITLKPEPEVTVTIDGGTAGGAEALRDVVDALRPPVIPGPGEPPNTLSDILVGESEANAPSAAVDDSAEATPAEAGAEAPSTAAPSPASATAPLSDDEIAALKDGSWKDWRFFTKRSVAAKISALPMNSSEDVTPVLEAKAAELAGA